MALESHIEILKSGKDNWNHWIKTNWEKMEGPIIPTEDGPGKVIPHTRADLRGINLKDFGDLAGYDFYKVDISNSKLDGIRFSDNRFRKADLSNCSFKGTSFEKCELDHCKFLFGNFNNSRFSECSLTCANLGAARFIQSTIMSTNMSNSRIYGISMWDCIIDNVQQDNLIISKIQEPLISVDNIEIAQFIYLLLSNKKIRKVINTITSKLVLILGRFTEQRLKALREIQNILRTKNYIPILFDFEKPEARDITETVSLLANLSKFVIADLTDAKSVPQELSHIIPFLPSVPVQPIILDEQPEYSMFEHFTPYPWVRETLQYTSRISDDFLDEVINKIEGTQDN